MWLFKKKVKQRRLEVRKNIPTQQGAIWRSFAAAGGVGSTVIALAFLAATSALLIFPAETFHFRLGKNAPKQYARVGFYAPNEQETKRLRELARQQTPQLYKYNKVLLAEVEAELLTLPAKVKDVEDLGKLDQKLVAAFAFKTIEGMAPFAKFADKPDSDVWRNAVGLVVTALGKTVILRPEDFARERGHRATEIILETPAGRVREDKWAGAITSTAKPQHLQRVVASLDLSVQDAVQGYLSRLIISGRPTYRLADDLTDQAMRAAIDAVPEQKDHYLPEKVIFKGGKITDVDLVMLRAEHDEYVSYLKQVDPSYEFRVAVGRLATGLLVVLALCGYVARYQRPIVRNHARGLAFSGVLLLMLGVTKALTTVAQLSPYVAAGAAVMGAIIITIAYDQRFALAIGALLSILLTVQLGQDVGFCLVLLTAVAVSVLLLKDIRSRNKLVEVGSLSAGAAFLATAWTQLALGRSIDLRLVLDSGYAGGAVLAVGLVIQGILPFIERIFRIATSMTLLEWCDANKKLLKRLAMEAPGTYNHSLLLGTITEAAAEAIGARGLLARVGSYYHDIGKINKPECFIENQFDSPSKHSKLSPAMSLLIITGHVKDGIEMAKEYGLPSSLHEFIASHHGTTLVQFFYHAATEQSKTNGSDRAPEEVEFRYPGPKPRSKEAAILMVADAVESAVRAMPELSPGRIEIQAHSIVTARLMDGQLDECDLTLREVHQIEESLVKSLCGIYHGRIAYPKTENKAQRQAQSQPAGT
ncbi:MAG: HDIG domain-containing protein [Planctomycetes bacterium]|nr:HDIG domain-containing protein [Planctomycetota bacterium]